MNDKPATLPRVVADTPLSPAIVALLEGKATCVPWQAALEGNAESVDGIYTFGHPIVDGAMLDRLPGVRIISNYGVGVDHIDVAAAAARGIPVGNTPGILNGATADMGFTLLLAAARRLAEGVRYAHGPDYLRHDPGKILGRDVHGQTLGIIGLGSIGEEAARRARAFNMPLLYTNRRRRPEIEERYGATYLPLAELLAQADFVMLCVPLTAETRGMIGRDQLRRMKPTAILVNIARGAVVDTDALTEALATRQIYAAGLDVTDPEPLPRDHPLLKLDNVTIAPHLGSATEQTRQAMAEMSVENLLRGLRGEVLLAQVKV